MDEADAEEAAELFDAEALAQVQRVVISVPGENAALTEKLRDFRGMVIADADRHRGAALVETAGIADAEEAKLGNREQAVDQAREQGSFVLMCYAIRGEQSASAIGCGGSVAVGQRRHVDHILRLRSARSSVQSASRMSTWRMTTPFSSSARQGATLASWSSVVTTISSPAFSSRPMARASAKVIVVMFWPKTTSSRSQWKKSAMAARAAATIASFARLVAKAPHALAFAVMKYFCTA